MWPIDAESLIGVQRELAQASVQPWHPRGEPRIGGCWVCFPRGLAGPGSPGDVAWAAAVVMRGGLVLEQHVRRGVTDAPYRPGLMALRVGRLMDATVRTLTTPPDVLLVDATSRDHPRGAGLALHLGAELGLPTVGVTHRPLLARGEWPEDRRGATSPLRIGDTVVACWARTRRGVRPVVVHPGWRVDVATAVDIVVGASGKRRTPEPLRRARFLARMARNAADGG